MTLVTGAELLAVASEHGFAVPALNLSDYNMMIAAFEVCEEVGSPLMVALGPKEGGWIGEDFIPAILARAHRSSVPTALHWDHGNDLDEVIRAIRLGYTSVMIDASLQPFEKNVEVTAEVVRIARAAGVSVEGELGTIGKTEGADEGGTDDILYTEPDEAVTFAERTGVDSLAIAIGTRHGIYPPDLKPELKLDLLDSIDAAVDVPLVLHGGSNNPDEEIRQACTRGINKVNISSDIKGAFYDGLRETLQDRSIRDPRIVVPPAMECARELVRHKIGLFGSADTLQHYGH
ncbi:ketose-bisphosphate aldolase [Bogoriella caseilytica]|uniref:Fructose-bisphosphate aldolase class II n=1 Tax=Bogoriella caseilytica TaxID=56055 RepID=A0A3N2BD17_9MICO|nr:ketose-bisphosphate aldolase [Bogoriella caseilytica]ROR73150.1 fructose-bisphosphate aldolase class II [Bogoriella caseilytica]